MPRPSHRPPGSRQASGTSPLVRVGMAPRARGLTMSAAQEHWGSTHGEVAGAIPGLRGYIQNHQILANGRPLLPYPGFDACSELEFDDVESMWAGFASQHYRGAVTSDEGRLIDGTRKMFALTSRIVVIDGEPPVNSVKLLTLLRAAPGADPASLIELLTDPYAEVARDAGALRHEVLATDHSAHPVDRPACCDAIDILWFETAEHALDAVLGRLSEAGGWVLAAHTFGAERVLAHPVRQV